jgi:hypothetical protein
VNLKQHWYVIDSQENAVSWNTKTDKGEEFSNRTAALKKAASLAKNEPHCAFFVVQATDLMVVETKPVQRTILVK